MKVEAVSRADHNDPVRAPEFRLSFESEKKFLSGVVVKEKIFFVSGIYFHHKGFHVFFRHGMGQRFILVSHVESVITLTAAGFLSVFISNDDNAIWRGGLLKKVSYTDTKSLGDF